MPKETLKENILKEIKKTGYPHELKVSYFLKNNKYFVANNLYYIDHDEGKGREVDIRALKNIEFRIREQNHYVRLCLLIECKKSKKDKPWVVFTSEQTIYDKAFYELDYKGIAPGFDLLEADKLMDDLALIHPPVGYERLGRSFFEPFKGYEERGTIFKSLTTSVKATIAMRDTKFGAGKRSICFYYPVIIFDGVLFEAYLKDDDIKVEEVDMVMASFFYESPKYKEEQFLVPILNEGALKNYFSELDEIHKIFGNFFKKHFEGFIH